MMETLVIKHGYSWWEKKGTKCPDCKSDKFRIKEQKYDIFIKKQAIHHHNDLVYYAFLECIDCNSQWWTTYREVDALPKNSAVLRGID